MLQTLYSTFAHKVLWCRHSSHLCSSTNAKIDRNLWQTTASSKCSHAIILMHPSRTLWNRILTENTYERFGSFSKCIWVPVMMMVSHQVPCSVHGQEHSWRVSSLLCGRWWDSLFSHSIISWFCQRSFYVLCPRPSLDFLFCPLDYSSILSPVPHYFISFSSMVNFWNIYKFSNFVLPFKNNVSYYRPSAISHKF